MTRTILFATFALALLPGFAAATDYTVQKASTLGFTGTFQGASFDGAFGQWHATIRYDAAHPADSAFDVTVDTASAHTGDKDRDGALPGADFFDAAKYPQARFVTIGFRTQGAQVLADGKLTLRGVTRPVTLTVSFHPAASGDAAMDVDGDVKRLDFGVGVGDYADTSVIGADVKVHAHLLLAPKP